MGFDITVSRYDVGKFKRHHSFVALLIRQNLETIAMRQVRLFEYNLPL